MKAFRRLSVAAAIAAVCATSAHAGNLLTNGDFEANGGSLDNWTVIMVPGAQVGVLTAADYHPCCFTVGSEPAYSDNHFVEFDDGNVPGEAHISQSFNTILGAHYTLSLIWGRSEAGRTP